jgi:hypothetical protein
LKTWEILDANGKPIGILTAEDIRWIPDGIDFQPNIFNGYHAIEFGSDNPPAVLNLPKGMSVRECQSGS